MSRGEGGREGGREWSSLAIPYTTGAPCRVAFVGTGINCIPTDNAATPGLLTTVQVKGLMNPLPGQDIVTSFTTDTTGSRVSLQVIFTGSRQSART